VNCIIQCLKAIFPCCFKEEVKSPPVLVRHADTVIHQVSRQALGEPETARPMPLDTYTWRTLSGQDLH